MALTQNKPRTNRTRMVKKSYKILIVEDHNVVRAGIKFMLDTIPEYTFTIHESDDEVDVLKRLTVNEYDIVLLDIELNGANGIDILQKIKAFNPSQKVIMLTMYNDVLTINKALKNKADGYILKNLIEEEIFLAIKTVVKGKKYLCNEVSQILLEDRETSSLDLLSKRERQIVVLIAEGLSNVEIGEKLSLSYRTIDTHKQNIYGKLGLKKNIELVRYAIKNNLIN